MVAGIDGQSGFAESAPAVSPLSVRDIRRRGRASAFGGEFGRMAGCGSEEGGAGSGRQSLR